MNMRDNKPFSRYSLSFKVLALVGIFPFLLIYVFCMRVGETLTLDEVVAEQFEKGGVYGTALHNPQNGYKLEIYRKVAPKVVALGNSRSMSFDAKYFTENSFVNAGGSVRTVSDFDEMMKRMTEISPFDTALVVVAWNWFNTEVDDARVFGFSEAGGIQAGEVFRVINWVLEGRLSLQDIQRGLFQDRRDIGITALVRGEGYTPYGSYEYGASRLRLIETDNVYARSVQAIGDQNYSFITGGIDEQKWQEFRRSVHDWKERGYEIVILYPPMHPSVEEEMSRHPHLEYVYEIGNRLQEMQVPVFNLLDSQSVELDACEFTDGTHIGEILAARVLRLIGENENLRIAGYLNQQVIDVSISKYSGQTTSSPRWQKPEREFLEKYGC